MLTLYICKNILLNIIFQNIIIKFIDRTNEQARLQAALDDNDMKLAIKTILAYYTKPPPKYAGPWP